MDNNNIMLLQCYYIENIETSAVLCRIISRRDVHNSNQWNEIIRQSKYNNEMNCNTFRLQDLIFKNNTELELFHNNIINKDSKEHLIKELNKTIYCIDITIPLYY
jgi:hypothetical protein